MLGTKVTVRDDFDLVFIALDRSVLAMVGEIGHEVENKAVFYVPVDTEALEDSIHMGIDGSRADVATLGSQVEHLRRKGRSYSGEDYSYAAYMEFGTSHSSAHAYMTYAASETAEDIDWLVREAFDREFTL